MMATTARNRRPDKQPEDKETSVSVTFAKAFTSEASWSDKDEFLDVIYWLRQVLGIILGIIWGLLPLKGIVGLALFFAVNILITYLYLSSFQKVDEEEYGGLSEILKEGLMTSFSSFLKEAQEKMSTCEQPENYTQEQLNMQGISNNVESTKEHPQDHKMVSQDFCLTSENLNQLFCKHWNIVLKVAVLNTSVLWILLYSSIHSDT